MLMNKLGHRMCRTIMVFACLHGLTHGMPVYDLVTVLATGTMVIASSVLAIKKDKLLLENS